MSHQEYDGHNADFLENQATIALADHVKYSAHLQAIMLFRKLDAELNDYMIVFMQFQTHISVSDGITIVPTLFAL